MRSHPHEASPTACLGSDGMTGVHVQYCSAYSMVLYAMLYAQRAVAVPYKASRRSSEYGSCGPCEHVARSCFSHRSQCSHCERCIGQLCERRVYEKKKHQTCQSTVQYTKRVIPLH
jgi:hypothetical protein